MDKNALWKWLILAALVAGSLYFCRDGFRLGIDLQGGTGFVVQVDEQRLRENLLDRYTETIKEYVADNYASDSGDARADRVAAIHAGLAQALAAAAAVQDDEDGEVALPSVGIPEADFRKMVDELGRIVEDAQEDAHDRALEVIRNRIDKMGIEEPVIYKGQNRRITIQLPAIDEEKRTDAKEQITSVAYLEFRLVHKRSAEWVAELFNNNRSPRGFIAKSTNNDRYYIRDLGEGTGVADKDMDEAFYERLKKFERQPGCEFLFVQDKLSTGQVIYRPYYVEVRAQLTGSMLASAWVSRQTLGQPAVSLKFDGEGKKKFRNVTKAYAPRGDKNLGNDVGRQLAVVLDGKLHTAPVLQVPIFNGEAQITGSFDLNEAQRIANVLRSGALPAPVKIIEERSVAPSLGADSISSGIRAILIGGGAVIVFMIVYYLISGVIANLALGLDLVLLPIGMITVAGFLGVFIGGSEPGGSVALPVLTLPGIAGIVLTLGMAVDANVLIFERIREELRSAKRISSAISAGYDKAFVTIMDANVTTLLTAIILFIIGSGPIRGFAVTLSAGIVVSMYTALVVTRMLYNVSITRFKLKSLKMLSIVGQTQVDFLGKRKIAAIVSAALIVAGVGYMSVRGGEILGVDFTGGSSVHFKVSDSDSKPSTAAVREVLTAAGIDDAQIQYGGKDVAKAIDYLEVKTTAEQAQKAENVLLESFADVGLLRQQIDMVGPQIGAEMRSKALVAIICAMLGIIIYVTWRFEWAFAVGAIAAIAHDVTITVGLYCLCGRQLSLPIVAALLTIVGYSVNDTIVVFDRIREDMKLERAKNFLEVCNLAVNRTLSRTLLTSLTTLITVVMLLVFGGGAINDFALALFIGILVGTYSSIFVATPVMVSLHNRKSAAAGQA